MSMKYLLMLCAVIVVAVFAASCTHTHSHPTGGGYSVECNCIKDTVTVPYNMGSKYPPYDSNKIDPVYVDSCNKIKSQNGFDSCFIYVLTL